ncbi:putative glutamyl-tRNA amidotransferase subunit A [Xylaria scruposa]|nr:putative glutamyl-tRNA amidotransferase subunit A [Xylaria scruposa]
MSLQFNVLTATATDLEDLLIRGTVTSEQVVDHYLHQIETYNGYLHAVISVAPRDVLVARSRQLDEERSRGQVRGPLHGIPVLVKDNIDTHPDLGMETTVGTYALVGTKVRDSAPHVKQLVDAGAIIIGKANLSELSNFRGLHMPTGWSAVGGLTQSPYVVGGKRWDDGYGGHSAVGGSSSGSCAGVAAGFAPVSIGTDTNASILMPATRNDVYALKPTLGLVSQDGICPISSDFDSAGPIARCTRDIAILLDTMVDRNKATNITNGTYTSELTGVFEGLRIGVLDPSKWHLDPKTTYPNISFDDQVDREVCDVYEKLALLGVVVKNVTLPPLKDLEVDGMSQIQRVMDSQFQATLESYLQGLDESKVRTLAEMIQFMRDHADLEFPPGKRCSYPQAQCLLNHSKFLTQGLESPNMTRLETALSFKISDEEYQKALADVREFGREKSIDKCLKENGIDIILGRADSQINNYYVSAGYPMAVLPLSYAKLNGRPFGMCVIATAHQEGLLIRFMSAWEKVFNKERQLPTWIGGDPSDKTSEL